jgi:hypothetical protein
VGATRAVRMIRMTKLIGKMCYYFPELSLVERFSSEVDNVYAPTTGLHCANRRTYPTLIWNI